MLASLVSVKSRVPPPTPSLSLLPFEPSPPLAGKKVRVGWNTWGTKDKLAKSHNRSSTSSIPCAEEAWTCAKPISCSEGVKEAVSEHLFPFVFIEIARKILMQRIDRECKSV